MMRALVQIVVNAVALYVAARLVPGIVYTGDVWQLLFAGLVVGLINLVVKPIVTFLSLPLILLTLGLFYLAINGLMLLLAAYLLPSLQVNGCVPAILGGLLMGVANWLVRAAEKKD